jgi:formate transporter
MPARDARPMSCIEGEAARKKSTVNGPMPESGAATNQASWPKGELLSPIEISARIVDWSLAKTRLSLDRLVVLGILGGLYIGFGAALFTLVMSGSSTGLGSARWLGGVAFSLGLVLVVIGGAELSTGNCLMGIARMRSVVSSDELWRNWIVSYLANAAGAAVLASIIVASGALDTEPLRKTVTGIAEAKLNLSVGSAFLKGMLANMLVCLAVWLSMSTTSVIGKAIGIVFPVSAFVALGFEHSIANLYLIPAGLMLGADGSVLGLVGNLTVVTLGNLVGGALVMSVLLGMAHQVTASQARPQAGSRPQRKSTPPCE